MWEKEKLLVTSNFSFSHSVFKRLGLETHMNKGLFGKGLKVNLLPSDSIFDLSKPKSVEFYGLQICLMW